jgi:hypothetical protein
MPLTALLTFLLLFEFLGQAACAGYFALVTTPVVPIFRGRLGRVHACASGCVGMSDERIFVTRTVCRAMVLCLSSGTDTSCHEI